MIFLMHLNLHKTVWLKKLLHFKVELIIVAHLHRYASEFSNIITVCELTKASSTSVVLFMLKLP